MSLLPATLAQVQALFMMLDQDGGGEVSIGEFLNGCMKLRGVPGPGASEWVEVWIYFHENRLKSIYCKGHHF